jgi:uncharacterized membrane protein
VRLILAPHIVAGGLGIVAGFVALWAAKGSRLHRKSGMIFVYAMLVLSSSGALMAMTWRPNTGNVMAGVLTFYLVLTAVLTVRRSAPWLDVGAMLVGLAGGLSGIALGFDAIARGGIRQGIPAPVFFIFGAIGLLAITGDVRMIRSGGLRGGPRLARHLWRMCLGLLIAAASFFLGPPGRVPELIRIPALLPVPVVVPLLAMFYWLWRVRIRRTLGDAVGAGVHEAG